MNHVLAAAFANDLRARLDDYDTLARRQGPAFSEQEARDAIQTLTDVVRVVLDGHTVDPHGHCTGCPRRGWRRQHGCRLLRALAQRAAGRPAPTSSPSGRHAYRP